VGPLGRRRLDHDVLEAPEAAAVREAGALLPGSRDDLEGLVEACPRLRRLNPETVELAVPVTLADAEVEATAGDPR